MYRIVRDKNSKIVGSDLTDQEISNLLSDLDFARVIEVTESYGNRQENVVHIHKKDVEEIIPDPVQPITEVIIDNGDDVKETSEGND